MPGSSTIDGALQQLAALAPGLDCPDVACYHRHGRDPCMPLVGLGQPDARWCFLGRDPGEQEVRLQRPFIGPAGQKIRAVMAEVGVGEDEVYWMNTVPFKPIGNKPWSMAARRQCRPALLELLAVWKGTEIITFGEAAFKWFGLDRAQRQAVEAFWQRPDKYEARFATSLCISGVERHFMVCPVPHPSGANAAWAARFPGLLRARLRDARAY